MSRGPAVRQADIERAIRALAACGQGVARIEVAAGGLVRVVPGKADLTAPAADSLSPLAGWLKDQQDAGRAVEGA